MRQPALIFVPYGKFTIFESLLPIAVEASQRNISCYTLLIGSGPLKVVDANPLYLKILGSYTNVRCLRAEGNISRRMFGFLRLIGLLLLMRVLHGPLTIIYNKKADSTKLNWLMNRLFQSFGRTFSLKPNHGTFTPVYMKRYESELGNVFQKEQLRRSGRSGLIPTESPLKKVFGSGETWLLTNNSERILLEELVGKSVKSKIIGLPRLYPSWKTAMEEICRPILDQECKNLGIKSGAPIMLFAPTNPNFALVQSPKSNENILRWLLNSMQMHFPDMVLVVKPKPQFAEFYQKILSDLGDDRVRLSTLPLPVWSVGTTVAVVVSPSAAVFEFFCVGVPTIEIADYPNWYKRFGFPWAGTPGLLLAEGKTELEEAILSIARGNFEVPTMKALYRHFGHDNRNLDSLIRRP